MHDVMKGTLVVPGEAEENSRGKTDHGTLFHFVVGHVLVFVLTVHACHKSVPVSYVQWPIRKNDTQMHFCET